MNGAQIHLLFNHIPVIGVPLAMLLLAYGLAARKAEVRVAALGLSVLIPLVGLVAYFSSDGAEKLVKGLPLVSQAAIESHEEMARIALIAGLVLSVTSAVALYLGRGGRKSAPGPAVICLVLAVITSVLYGWTAHIGGTVRHSEIRGSSTSAPAEKEKDSD